MTLYMSSKPGMFGMGFSFALQSVAFSFPAVSTFWKNIKVLERCSPSPRKGAPVSSLWLMAISERSFLSFFRFLLAMKPCAAPPFPAPFQQLSTSPMFCTLDSAVCCTATKSTGTDKANYVQSIANPFKKKWSKHGPSVGVIPNSTS